MIERVPKNVGDINTQWVSRLPGGRDIRSIGVTRIGEDYGFAAATHRVDIASDGAAAPLAVKLCDSVTAVAEQHVYEQVLTRTSVPRPRFVAAAVDGDRGVVVYEFVAGIQGDVLAGVGERSLKGLIDALGDLHAKWWTVAPESGLPDIARRLRRDLGDEQVELCIDRYGDELGDPARSLIRSLPENLSAIVAELLEHPRTVVHGDAHLDNVLIQDGGTPVLLDWSAACVAPAGVDLARCYVECLTHQQRKRLWPMLVERYRRAIDRQGVTDYTRAELERGIHLALLAFVPGVVRWAASGDVDRKPVRAEQTLRNALRSVNDIVD